MYNPSHNGRSLLIFNGFWCEGLEFQPFTSGRSRVTIRERHMNGGWYMGEAYVNPGRSKPSHGKPPVNKGAPPTKRFSRREHLKIRTFTLETHGNQQKTSCLWRSESFFGRKIRIRERAKRGEKRGEGRHNVMINQKMAGTHLTFAQLSGIHQGDKATPAQNNFQLIPYLHPYSARQSEVREWSSRTPFLSKSIWFFNLYS